MRNPFQYGNVVGQEAFCNRKEELSDLRRAMENGEKLFVYSERRLGKTSLVKLVLQKLPKSKFVKAYVDLLPTDSETGLATATARALAESTASGADKLLKLATNLFTRLSPSLSVDDQGKPTLNFGIEGPRTPEPGLAEVLASPPKIAASTGRRVVVVFDEFQQLLAYGSDTAERKLRSIIQNHADVAYIFLGSKKHLIQGMFLDRSRPLYRAAGHYPLQPIQQKHWIPFIRERFHRADKIMPESVIRTVFELTEGHPFYTQHLCYVLWELAEEGAPVSEVILRQAVDIVLDREGYAYSTLWESLTANQRRFLKGLAQEPVGVRTFASAFTRRYGLRSASNAQRAVAALIEKDVIEPTNGSYVIDDRFLAIWIRRELSAL